MFQFFVSKVFDKCYLLLNIDCKFLIYFYCFVLKRRAHVAKKMHQNLSDVFLDQFLFGIMTKE